MKFKILFLLLAIIISCENGGNEGRNGDTSEDKTTQAGTFESAVEPISAADSIRLSSYYKVYVRRGDKWKEMVVRDALCSDANKHRAIWNDWDNSKALRDTMSYCIFEDDFSGPVEVLVEKLDGQAKDVRVRPTLWEITPEIKTDGRIAFTIPSYEHRKVSVEFDGDRQHNLFLFPVRPDGDKPTESSYGTKYYGPGEHHEGKVTLHEGETLYIDYGAILYAEVQVVGNDCTVAGHGVLCGDDLRHYGDQYSNGAIILNCNPGRPGVLKNLLIKDITIINGPSWNVSVYNYDGVTIDGVNAICWELNGDGIDIVCSKNVEIKNCFLRNYDDCITLKVRFNAKPESDLSDVHIHHNLIWNDYARGIVIGPEAGNRDYSSGYIHDVLVEDCIILQHKAGRALDDLRAGFAIGQYASPDNSWGGGTAERIEMITARNLVFDNIDVSGRNVALWQYPDMDGICFMRHITLENFTILNENKVFTPAIYVQANQHSLNGLHLKNIMMDGKRITARGDSLVIHGDVTFDIE